MLGGEKAIEDRKMVSKLEINENLLGGREQRRKEKSKEGGM